MSSRRCLWPCAVWISLGILLGVEELTDLQQILAKPAKQMKAEVWKRTKAEQVELRRVFMGTLHPNTDKTVVANRLVYLGDREATKDAVDAMAADPTHTDRVIGGSGSPYAVELLAPHFFGTEPYSLKGYDVLYAPWSFTAALTAIRVIADSSAFNSDVGNWARRMEKADREAIRSMMQEWWTENKEAFAREDWKAVKPGRELLAGEELLKQRVAAANANQAALPISPEPRKSAGLEPIAAQEEQGSGGVLWIATAVLTALAAGLTIIIRSGRRI